MYHYISCVFVHRYIIMHHYISCVLVHHYIIMHYHISCVFLHQYISCVWCMTIYHASLYIMRYGGSLNIMHHYIISYIIIYDAFRCITIYQASLYIMRFGASLYYHASLYIMRFRTSIYIMRLVHDYISCIIIHHAIRWSTIYIMRFGA